MQTILGIDGCSTGWLVAKAQFDSHSGTLSCPEICIVRHWVDVTQNADIIAVDMPIGLTDYGRRRCDRLARQKLQARSASVFTPPRRPMLSCTSYDEANSLGKSQGPFAQAGGGLSKQAWNLVPKIREIDSWMTPDRQKYVFEAHPELAFMRMNAENGLPPKQTAEGRLARERLISRTLGKTAPSFLERYWPTGAKADDVLDALALVVTARHIARGTTCRLPEESETDARGLRMEILY